MQVVEIFAESRFELIESNGRLAERTSIPLRLRVGRQLKSNNGTHEEVDGAVKNAIRDAAPGGGTCCRWLTPIHSSLPSVYGGWWMRPIATGAIPSSSESGARTGR